MLEWNKNQIPHTECTFKTNYINKVDSSAKIQNSSQLVLNSKRVPTFRFKATIQHQEIPTIETTTFSKNKTRNNIPECKKIFDLNIYVNIYSFIDYIFY